MKNMTMSEEEKKELLDEIDYLMLGCPPSSNTDKLRSLIESAGRPKVDEKFIEKWAEILYNTGMGKFRDTIKAMLKEAGVSVEDKGNVPIYNEEGHSNEEEKT